MIVCVDFTSLRKGGGIQVANSFIVDICKNRDEYNFSSIYIFIGSENVDLRVEPQKGIFVVYLKNRNFIINTFVYSYLIFKYKIDKIFTLFGPASFFTFKTHIIGFARPHILYPDSPYFQSLSSWKYLKSKFYYFLISYLFYIQADIIIVETKDAYERLKSKFFFRGKEIFVVSNMLNSVFLKYNRVKQNSYPDELRILFVSSYYSHKNFQFFENLAFELNNSKFKGNYKITLTIDEDEFPLNVNLKESFIFLGPVSINEIPQLYQKANVIIHPSLLEVFSASYIESIYMLKMIITIDMDFAKSILKGYGFFMSKNSAIECIKIIQEHFDHFYLDPNTYDDLIGPYIDSNSRTSQYISIINNA